MNIRVLTSVSLCIALLAAAAHAQANIKVTPAGSPFEGSVAQATTLTFNIHIEDEEGEPATLENQTVLDVEIAAWEDEEAGLSIDSVDQTWTLPQGFAGGQRTVAIAVVGAPPGKAVTASLTLSYAIGEGDPVDVALHVSARAGSPDGTHVDFMVPRAKGDGSTGYINAPGQELELFRDFGSVKAVGVINAMGGDADSVGGALQYRVVEVIGGEETATTALSTADAEFTAIDADDNGKAEVVQTTFTLQAAEALSVAPDAKREFRLYVRRTDLNPVVDLFIADIVVTARETGSGRFLDLQGVEQYVSFGRQQSVALAAVPKIYKNGVLQADAIQATATLKTGGGNGWPDRESGLYDLTWKVAIDWERLKKRTNVAAGDTIRVDLTFPGTSVTTISASCPVLDSGNQFTSFKKLEDMENEQYDNGKTEKDYLDELIAALKAAGMVVGGGAVRFPPVHIPPGAFDPNWKDVRDALRDLENALEDFKKKERKKNGVDQVAGKSEFEIDVFVEIDGVLVRIRIKMGDKEKPVKVNDSDKHPEEKDSQAKKDAPVIVIGLGGDGKDATGSNNGTDGAKSEVEIGKKGSIGISKGGNGGKGEAGDPNASGKKGGKGGDSEVEIDSGKDPQDQQGPSGSEGISIGGHGGNSNGEGGSGGNAKSSAKKGSDSKVVAEAGNGGHSKFPPKPANENDKVPPKSGTAEVDNQDGVKKSEKASAPSIANNGYAGQAVGGMAGGASGQPSTSTKGGFEKGPNPVTGN